MNTLFYFDCLGHQEFKNMGHDWLRELTQLMLLTLPLTLLSLAPCMTAWDIRSSKL